MITKDHKDVSILEITPENYLVPQGEELFYHVKMEIKSFNQDTGERQSHPFIQKFTRIDFENGMMSTLRKQGYTMDILHDPKAWIAAHQEELAKSKEQKAAEAKAREEAEKEALKESLKEEVRKELLKEMAGKKEEEGKDAGAKEPDPAGKEENKAGNKTGRAGKKKEEEGKDAGAKEPDPAGAKESDPAGKGEDDDPDLS